MPSLYTPIAHVQFLQPLMYQVFSYAAYLSPPWPYSLSFPFSRYAVSIYAYRSRPAPPVPSLSKLLMQSAHRLLGLPHYLHAFSCCFLSIFSSRLWPVPPVPSLSKLLLCNIPIFSLAFLTSYILFPAISRLFSPLVHVLFLQSLLCQVVSLQFIHPVLAFLASFILTCCVLSIYSHLSCPEPPVPFSASCSIH